MGVRSWEFTHWILSLGIVIALIAIVVVVFDNVSPHKITIIEILHTEDVNEFRVFQRKCLAKKGIVNINNYDGIGAWRVSCRLSCRAWEEKE